MRVTLLTNEFPPHVYGGAGVHVEYLSRALAALAPGENKVDVFSFGDQRVASGDISVTGVAPDFKLPSQNGQYARLLDTLVRDLMMAGSVQASDVVHGHTWYSHFAGCLVKQLFRVPLVLTTHSLEPHRPWKVEQLGNAYHASSWLEKTAYQNADGVIAVSQAMKRDVQELYGVPAEKVRVIPNGIDVEEYSNKPNPEVLRKHGVDPGKPFILFVGRITRQKGILHLLHALRHLPQGAQVALCAGAPDTPEIGAEMTSRVAELRRARPDLSVAWIDSMIPREETIAFYSHAALFVCPSVYEPFGIINLEAMACGAPVVASKVGGIPEAVADGETGILVDVDSAGADFEPRDPEAFVRRLADAINALMADPGRRAAFAEAGRRRVVEKFSWESVAAQTLDFYKELVARNKVEA
ncbi:MAG TPA: glycogen synthase [Fibrobacteria bacterium]|nr:glycogen synthase [Fibrobacteria bacterium]